MSPRSAWPRSWHQHELKAAEVLRRHASQTGWRPALPVPVELVIEQTFGLRIACQRLSEPAGVRVLGALEPATRTIYLNETHEEMFERWVGPERFTLAHELGHWLYDADDPDQQSLLEPAETIFCRGPMSDLDDVALIRERNADRFAARLLMPGDLVCEVLAEAGWPLVDRRVLARDWGVSRRALDIRLGELCLLPTDDRRPASEAR